MSLTVVTYGGGEILRNVFDAVAMLMNGKTGGLFQPLMVLAASIGAIMAITKAFFSPSLEAVVGRYFIPLLGVTGILLIPTTHVQIEDVIQNRSYRVDHVPLLLGRFSELVSSIGYRVTTAIEKAMHTPRDVNYSSTGMIFGSDTSIDMRNFKITNPDLEQNLRRFSKQCMLYDIALDRYNLKDLKTSTDLWNFLGQNTSNVRKIQYVDPEERDPSKRTSYRTCREAIRKMTPYFNKEVDYYSKQEVFKHLPLSLQALTGLQNESKDIIGQQLVMNTISEEYSSDRFAKHRASAHQRSTYRVLGSLAATSIVSMRAVLEALVIASFIFVMPLSLLPSGFSFITKWLGLLLWIQMWPPFFAILSYVMQTVAQQRAEGIFSGLAQSEVGLSYFTSAGLLNLQEDIFALAGYLSASIPFISYAILQGGTSAFIHLAGAMMTPAHNAASVVAGEQTTGNYSFGNASYGQLSYENTTGYQKNISPGLNAGYFSENTGDASTVYGSSGVYHNQSVSNLRTGINASEVITDGLQKNYQQAVTSAESKQAAYSTNVSQQSRNLADFIRHCGKQENYSEGTNHKLGYDLGQSSRSVESMASDWGKQYGFSSQDSLDILTAANGSGGLRLMQFGAGVEGKLSNHATTSRNEILQSAERVAQSSDFSTRMQQLEHAAKSENLGWSTDVGARAATTYAESVDKTNSSLDQAQKAFSEVENASMNLSWAESNSKAINQNLNQDFLNFAAQKSGGYSRAFDRLSSGEMDRDAHSLVGEYVSHIREGDSFLNRTNAVESVDEWYKSERDSRLAAHENDSQQLSKAVDLHSEYSNLDSVAKEFRSQFSHPSSEKNGGGMKGRFAESSQAIENSLAQSHDSRSEYLGSMRSTMEKGRNAVKEHYSNRAPRFIRQKKLALGGGSFGASYQPQVNVHKYPQGGHFYFGKKKGGTSG